MIFRAETQLPTVNYRSVAEVRDSFVSFAANMSVVAGEEVALDADRGESGHVPERREVGTDEEEVVAVAEAIEKCEMPDTGIETKPFFVRATTNWLAFARPTPTTWHSSSLPRQSFRAK